MFVCMLLQYVFAWIPSDVIMCDIDIDNMPEETAYVDLLIRIDGSDEDYTEFNAENGAKFGISEKSEIVSYNDNFQSYTFHIKNSFSEMKPFDIGDGWYCVQFISDTDGSLDEFREKYKAVKLAYLDEFGNVLGLTDEADIYGHKSGSVALNIGADGENLTCEISAGPPYWLIIAIPLAVILVAVLAIAVCIVYFVIATIKKIR